MPSASSTRAVAASNTARRAGSISSPSSVYIDGVPATTATTEAVAEPGPTSNGPTTSSTLAPGGPESTQAPPLPALEAVVLDGKGLGVTTFGDPVEEALARLGNVLGQPTQLVEDRETMIAINHGQYGGPDATTLLATWDNIGLLVAFSDYPFYRDDGVMHMSGWMVFASSPVSAVAHTAEGIGVGSTFAEVQAVYGDRFISGDGECGPWAMLLPPGEDDVRFRVVLWFIDLGAGDRSSLEGLRAGAGSGC